MDKEEPKKIIMDYKIEQQINSMMGCNGAIEASKFNVDELYPYLNQPKLQRTFSQFENLLREKTQPLDK